MILAQNKRRCIFTLLFLPGYEGAHAMTQDPGLVGARHCWVWGNIRYRLPPPPTWVTAPS